ncbi:L-threonylcarbamoyladenylate synthase [Longimicrobium sp.]|uniref:L-threonylcarbamoyladenylate synthase n=1 Tax=Longimicrobium sp. TaxID=2029185 RepID=UPI002C5E427F|nr:L-threonylcarbamoyladenylate synthase [Longimicrobium sp.]HSU14330.1 L-threonylcarbamoyladenylate synthase [Longimicrobium sp.]
MRILRVDSTHPDPAALADAAAVLRGGGLVAFPTETVYGLGAHALDPAAVARIYEAKGRPSYNPLIVHVASIGEARGLASAWPEAADRLAERFWPGPLTLVVPKSPEIPDAVSAGLDTVGVRIPAHPVAHALLLAAGVPLAAPSANRSMGVSPTTAEHVRRSLGGRVDVIVDGGPCPVGIESTVLSLAGEVPTVLRPGSISIGELREVLGEVAAASAEPSGRAARPSPGMLDRHYAPAAEVRLFSPAAREATFAKAVWAATDERRVGVIAFAPVSASGAEVVAMPADVPGYAARLYAALHAMDAAGAEVIWIEQVPDAPEWAGVRDRLRRAATGAAVLPGE